MPGVPRQLVGTAVVAAVVLGSVVWAQRSDGVGGKDPLTDEIERLPWAEVNEAKGQVAAYVNGVAITRDAIVLGRALSGAPESEVLEEAIAEALLYQEAARLGYGATPTEVSDYLNEVRATAPPELLEFVLGVAAGMGLQMTEDEYWEHPEVTSGVGRMLTIGNYLWAVMGSPRESQPIGDLRREVRAQKVAELRSRAEIVIVNE